MTRFSAGWLFACGALLFGYLPGAMCQEPKQPTDYLGDPLPEGAVRRLGAARLRHPGPVYGLRFTPDGKSLLSFGAEAEPVVWDVSTGRRTTRDDLPKYLLRKHALGSPDGRHFAVFSGQGKELALYDAATGKELFRRTHDKLWDSLAFSRDGKTVRVLTRDNQVVTWALPGGAAHGVQEFAFNNWPAYAFEEPPAPALTDDGTILAGVLRRDWLEQKDQTRVRFWDPRTGKESRPALDLRRGCYRWRWSEDGRLLTVFYRDYDIEIWDTVRGKPLELGKGVKLGGDAALLFPESKQAVLAVWGSVFARDLATGKTLWDRRVAPPHASGPGLKLSSVGAVVSNADGKLLAVATNCGHIELLDRATGAPVNFSRQHPGFFAAPLQFFSDSRHVLVNHGDQALVWDLDAGRRVRDLATMLSEGELLSPDGKSLATYAIEIKSDQTTIRLSDPVTGQERWSRVTHFGELRFAADSTTLAHFDRRTSSVQFLDAKSGKVVRTFRPLTNGPNEREPAVVGKPVAVSADLRRVTVETTDRRRLQLWDAVAGKELWDWELPEDCRGRLKATHFVPGGQYLAVGMDTRTDIKVHLFVLDLHTGKVLRTIDRWCFHAFSADGRYAALTTENEPFRHGFEVRDLHSGEVVLSRRIGATREVHCCFSPDGRRFACNPDGGDVECYDLQTRQRLGSPRQHWSYVRQLTFTPDGKSLAACYNDSTVLFWAVPSPGR